MLAKPLAPAVPVWLIAADEDAANMQVDDEILNCAAFLGAPAEYGFNAEGTGFFVYVDVEDMAFIYVVSCRHVVRPTKSRRDPTPNDDPIWIRVNRSGGKPAKTIKTKRSDWFYPADRKIDICVYPFDLREHADEDWLITTLHVSDDPTKSIAYSEAFQRRWGLSLGDEVFIVSCFTGRVGEQQNIPVLRLGSIAAKPSEPIAGVSHQSAAYLIETHSLGGVSGSPIFLHVEPGRRLPKPRLVVSADGKQKHAPYFLIAVFQGFHSGQYASDFIGKDEEEDDQKIVPVDTDFNAGIGIGVPIERVIELINRSDLAEARMRTVEAKKKQTGAHDASARRRRSGASESAPPATDENPKHREDFNSLAALAARKRERED